MDFIASIGRGPSRRERIVTAMGALHAHGDALVRQLWDGTGRDSRRSTLRADARRSRARRPFPSS